MSFEKKQWRANDDLTAKEMNDLEERVGGAIELLDKDTGWVNFGNDVKARRKGNIVTILGDSATFSTGPNAHVTVLSEEFRPPFTITVPMSSKGSSVNRSSLQCLITNNGRITVYSTEEQKTTYWNFLATYVVD